MSAIFECTLLSDALLDVPGSVILAVNFRVLDEFAVGNVPLHVRDGREVVVHAVLLAFPRGSRRVTDAEPELIVGEALLQQVDQRALADAGRAANDHGL